MTKWWGIDKERQKKKGRKGNEWRRSWKNNSKRKVQRNEGRELGRCRRGKVNWQIRNNRGRVEVINMTMTDRNAGIRKRIGWKKESRINGYVQNVRWPDSETDKHQQKHHVPFCTWSNGGRKEEYLCGIQPSFISKFWERTICEQTTEHRAAKGYQRKALSGQDGRKNKSSVVQESNLKADLGHK